jgi:HlyD family secretion protein
MNIMRRHWIVLVCVLSLAAALGLVFSPRPATVEVARATRGPLRVTVDEDGRTRIKERYVVSTPLGGQLRRISLHSGDCVVAGETLVATLEPAASQLLDARAREQLEARVRAAEVQVQSAGARLERVRAAHELAHVELARATTLTEQGAIARREFDQTREVARATTEELKAAEYTRQIAGFELEQARAAVSWTSSNSRNADGWDLRILSPVDGRVLRVFHEDAGLVAATTRLVELGDPADLEVEVDVLSSDAVQIRAGAPALFEHWGGDVSLEGRVRVVEPAGYLKISALGVEEQRVNVIVDLVTPADRRRGLGDAYRVEARIVVWEADDVLKVPVGALFRSEGEWAVFAVVGGRARLTRVMIGHSNGRETEIVGGLASGDAVVIHASDKVADGVRIKLRTKL